MLYDFTVFPNVTDDEYKVLLGEGECYSKGAIAWYNSNKICPVSNSVFF